MTQKDVDHCSITRYIVPKSTDYSGMAVCVNSRSKASKENISLIQIYGSIQSPVALAMTDYRISNMRDVACKTNGTLLGFSCVIATYGDILGYIDVNQDSGAWAITSSEVLIVVPEFSIVDFDLTGSIISCVGIKANES